MELEDFPFSQFSKISFVPKPKSLPADLRPLYRIMQILAVLKINCRGGVGTLLQLQFFNWVLKNPELRNLVDNGSFDKDFSLALIHVDPLVNIALKISIAEDLVSIEKSGKYKISTSGLEFIDIVLEDPPESFRSDLLFLKRIKKQVSHVKLRGRKL